MADQSFTVTFKVPIKVTSQDVSDARKENRNFLSSAYFTKDQSVAEVIAFNKAYELIVKHDNQVKVIVTPEIIDSIINK